MLRILLAASLLAGMFGTAGFENTASAHIGTEGGCSYYDIQINSSHWHVCASAKAAKTTITVQADLPDGGDPL